MLKCRNCSYVLYKFNDRVKHYQKVLTDFEIEYPGFKFSDSWYHQSQSKILNDIERHCYCQKYDMPVDFLKHYVYPCEDTFIEIAKPQNHSKRKRRNKRERDQKHKNHLKFLAENIQYYPSPVIYIDEIYIEGEGWIDNLKPYYKRCYRGNHKGNRYKFYKKYSNRCVRRYRGEIHNNGNHYRKIFDYW